jgi:hypothetical protein
VFLPAAQCRCTADEHGEPERNSVDANFIESGNVRGRKRQQDSKEFRRAPRAEDTSDDRDRNVFDQKEPDDLSVAGAKRLPDGDLVLPHRASKQEQGADVEARCEEYDRGRGRQKEECRPHFAEDQRPQWDGSAAEPAPFALGLPLERGPELLRGLLTRALGRQPADRHHLPGGG